MISIPVGMGDLPCGYDICFTDDIRFAYEGNGYYIIFAQRKYIISHKRYIIEKHEKLWHDYNERRCFYVRKQIT